MKKTALAIALFCGFSSIASAQWTPETEWGAVPFVADYTLANGRLASPQYRSFSGIVSGELDLRRIWINAFITSGNMISDQHTEGSVVTETNGFAYGRITHLINTGWGTLSGDYIRLRCESIDGGYCIARKTTVSCAKAPSWGCWGMQDGIGENVDIWHIIDGDLSQPVTPSYVNVVTSNVSPTQAVWQWNVPNGATGDALRLVGSNRVLLRITAEGKIILPSGKVLE